MLRRPIPVFAMHADHIRREDVERRDRIASAVQDHVGRIEVDAQVGAARGQQEVQQHRRRFLTGLQRERLVVLRGAIAHAARHFTNRLITL